MTVYVGPPGSPTPLTVTAQEPWHVSAMTVHRGLGGSSQVVWTASPPDAGARLTVRVPATELPAVLDMLHAPHRLEVTTDDPVGCPIQTGEGAVVRTNTVFRFDLTPTAAEVQIELAYT